MRRVPAVVFVFAIAVVLTAVPASAQDAPPACPCPPEPDPGAWVGSAGFGLALNRGNTDTTNINLSFDATYDPKTTSVWKFEGLYLRGETDGELNVDRLFTRGRYERDLTTRLFAFGELQYLQDEFKAIDYLIAPVAGIGFKIIDTDPVQFSVDAGAGVKWEKNPGLDVQTSGTITAGDNLSVALSDNASLTQRFSALWDADDFGDALYTFGAGLATNVTGALELKVEVLETISTRPPNPTVGKSDVAFLTSLVYKF